MPWIATGAGAVGLVLTYYLLGASQRAWPLVTSGMPIVPNWTNLIIIFEMTMLSAILATVITLLVTAGIPSRGGKMYDPEVSDGYILVGVENPADAASLEPALDDRRRPREDRKLNHPQISQITQIVQPGCAWSPFAEIMARGARLRRARCRNQ